MRSEDNINKDNQETEISPPKKEFRRIMKVMFNRWVVVFGITIIFIFILLAMLGRYIAPHDPYEQNLNNILSPSCREHLLGTDALGRDILSRIIYGTSISLIIGVIAISIASTIGMGLGLIAGFFGGWVNHIIMRFIDAFMAIPPIALALAIAAVLGGGLKNVMIAIGIAMVPSYCRLMCSQVLSIKESDYILAAYASGASKMRIMLRHLLPNSFPPMLVLITLNIGNAILIEAGLSFLGIGITPPHPTWGSMVSDGYRYLLVSPIISFAPGIAIILVVLSFNMVGDGLRDALDPRLRGTL